MFEQSSELREKVDLLMKFATCIKAQKWETESRGLMHWLANFLFKELQANWEAQRVQSILTRASLSLEQTLALLPESENVAKNAYKQQEPKATSCSFSTKIDLERNLVASRQREEVSEKEANKKFKTMH
ncbi:hypothetical protein CCR75_006328 [Bremia lactucae]|uniref:Uncharacterized protein n=1 Tax=Bremia lactucae TaxID=4779 RepID=A0A976IGZ0_BRELC|nr:hypothetical protein CCR75_006328 [Bremia lactucae]